MAEATLVEQLEVFQPGIEVVTLEVTDGETWASRFLGVIKSAHVDLNENDDGAHNVTFSGATATMNLAGVTNKNVTLTLRGTH